MKFSRKLKFNLSNKLAMFSKLSLKEVYQKLQRYKPKIRMVRLTVHKKNQYSKKKKESSQNENSKQDTQPAIHQNLDTFDIIFYQLNAQNIQQICKIRSKQCLNNKQSFLLTIKQNMESFISSSLKKYSEIYQISLNHLQFLGPLQQLFLLFYSQSILMEPRNIIGKQKDFSQMQKRHYLDCITQKMYLIQITKSYCRFFLLAIRNTTILEVIYQKIQIIIQQDTNYNITFLGDSRYPTIINLINKLQILFFFFYLNCYHSKKEFPDYYFIIQMIKTWMSENKYLLKIITVMMNLIQQYVKLLYFQKSEMKDLHKNLSRPNSFKKTNRSIHRTRNNSLECYQNLKNKKAKNSNNNITEIMRAILLDWIFQVSDQFKFLKNSTYRAIFLIDKYIIKSNITKEKLQLLGITALFIAHKLQQSILLSMNAFVEVTDYGFTKQQLMQMETKIITLLKWKISTRLIPNYVQQIVYYWDKFIIDTSFPQILFRKNSDAKCIENYKNLYKSYDYFMLYRQINEFNKISISLAIFYIFLKLHQQTTVVQQNAKLFGIQPVQYKVLDSIFNLFVKEHYALKLKDLRKQIAFILFRKITIRCTNNIKKHCNPDELNLHCQIYYGQNLSSFKIINSSND